MKTLLKLQIGPVQDFIAQARSTRDLWSGSYLLSWLMAAGLHDLTSRGPEIQIVYPAWDTQPLGKLRIGEEVNPRQALIPNLPNVLLAVVPTAMAAKLAADIEKTIRAEWMRLADEVWKFCDREGISCTSSRERYDAQTGRFLSIAWHTTPFAHPSGSDWSQWTAINARQLDAVRQTRAFEGWNPGGWTAGRTNNKDSLNGRDEAVAGGPGWQETVPRQFQLLFKHDDWIGSVTLIKRVWHLAYLTQPPWNFRRDDFKMPNTVGIAAHDPFAGKKPAQHDEDDAPSADELPPSEKHFAVVAFDGDKMGVHIRTFRSATEHTEFSGQLGRFALEQVTPIVEGHDGRVIYAGGDDVLALLPADTALVCAQDLRKSFLATTGCDASAGIAIAHFKSPLQDVVRAALAAEKRAKNQLGRSALAINLFKRSGETIEWGCNWDCGGLALYCTIANALEVKQLVTRFPYRVAELLQPYLTETSQFTTESQLITTVDGFDKEMGEVVRREFGTALSRQTPLKGDEKKALADTVTPKLDTYLQHLEARFTDAVKKFEKRCSEGQAKPWERPRKPDFICGALIGLCQTVAFARRTSDDNGDTEKRKLNLDTPATAERQTE